MNKIEAEANTDKVIAQYFEPTDEQENHLPGDEVDVEE